MFMYAIAFDRPPHISIAAGKILSGTLNVKATIPLNKKLINVSIMVLDKEPTGRRIDTSYKIYSNLIKEHCYRVRASYPESRLFPIKKCDD